MRSRQSITIAREFLAFLRAYKETSGKTWEQMGLRQQQSWNNWKKRCLETGAVTVQIESIVRICDELDYCGSQLGVTGDDWEFLRGAWLQRCQETGKSSDKIPALVENLPKGWLDFVSDDLSRYSPPEHKRRAGSQIFTMLGVGALGGVGVLVILAVVLVGRSADNRVHQAHELLRDQGPWITYDPSTYVAPNKLRDAAWPDREEIAADLDVIQGSRTFGGIVTFGSDGTLWQIPEVAKERGLSVIMGIFVARGDPNHLEMQVERAISQREYADAYVVGHMSAEDFDHSLIASVIDRVRKETGKPVSFTIPIDAYVGAVGGDLFELGDFLCPDIRCSWREGSDVDAVLRDMQEKIDRLAERRKKEADLRPVLLKMVSYPSGGGDTMTQQAQCDFYTRLLREEVSHPPGYYRAYAKAFDPPPGDRQGLLWTEAESHIGLFTNQREPKLALKPFEAYAAQRPTRVLSSGDNVSDGE